MIDRVDALADNDVKMGLASGFGILDALLDNCLCFLDKLAVEVNGIRVYSAGGIVFAEDEL